MTHLAATSLISVTVHYQTYCC